jgi:pentatricopeptide repeat protein
VDAVLRLCAKERRGAAALEALRSAERVGLPVDVTMFTTAVAACARKGQLPLAMEVYDSARAQGLANDPILINALINTCAKAGEVRLPVLRLVC